MNKAGADLKCPPPLYAAPPCERFGGVQWFCSTDILELSATASSSVTVSPFLVRQLEQHGDEHAAAACLRLALLRPADCETLVARQHCSWHGQLEAWPAVGCWLYNREVRTGAMHVRGGAQSPGAGGRDPTAMCAHRVLVLVLVSNRHDTLTADGSPVPHESLCSWMGQIDSRCMKPAAAAFCPLLLRAAPCRLAPTSHHHVRVQVP